MAHDKPLPVVLVRQLPGRARLHLEIEDEDGSAARELVTALAEHPSVRETRVNTRARSLLILHSGEIASILADAEARGLLALQARPAPRATLSLRSLKQAIDQADERMLEQTNDGVGLAGVTFVALAAAGVWQALNGQLLPAGTTLFSYALDVMRWGAEREGGTSPTSPSS